MRFIGDTHGNFDVYLNIIKDAHESIHVGDFGIGFRPNPTHKYDITAHKFIRGNHDWLYGCTKELNWIPDGHYDADKEIFFVGGAYSIDRGYRTEGIDWWADEELSYDDLEKFIDDYEKIKPRIVVSHECPDWLTKHFDINYYEIPSRTRKAFETMWNIHKPELWVFGHWHLNFDKVFDKTRFICLNANSYIDIDLNGDLREGSQKFIHRGF